MTDATKTRQEIHQLAELLGAVAEQVRTGRIEELRGDVSTLAEVVGATSESLRIFAEEFAAAKVPELRADIAGRIDAVREVIETKRAELAKRLAGVEARTGEDASALKREIGETVAELKKVESTSAILGQQFAAALEKAKGEIEA